MPNARKLRVGLVFDDTLDSNDGVAQQVKRLGEWLSRNGHHVVYLCGETKTSEWAGGRVYSLAKNLKVTFNGNRLSMSLLSSGRNIRRVLNDEKLDIVHVMTPYSPFMAQRVINKAYKDSTIVGSFHILPSGPVSSIGSRLLHLIQWQSLKKFTTMSSVSSSAAVFARQNFGLKSGVVPNADDLAALKPHMSVKIVDGQIVFLGRLVKRKGCAQLIKAFSLIAESHPDTSLVIAGDGVERPKLEKLVAKLELQQRVSFLGFIKEEEKADLLASAAIACFPSPYGESFGVVLIEAMAAGAGVVLAGDNPGYQTVMEAQPKLLVDTTDAAEFADRLIKLLEDKALAKKMHTWQIEHVKQYDINIVGQQYLDIYNHSIAKSAQKRHN